MSVGEVKKNQQTVWWCEEENFGVRLSYDSDLSQIVCENRMLLRSRNDLFVIED